MQKTGTYESMPHSELRHDPIQRRWVIVASERGKRPLHFSPFARMKAQGEACPFCRGNEEMTPSPILSYGRDGRSVGNGDWVVRVVPNKYPALRVEGELDRQAVGQYDRMNGVGAHEVVIETPEHDVEMGDLPVEHIALILKVYRERILDLSRDIRLKYILVFKNSGEAGGASLPHAHSQIMATPTTPRTLAGELASAQQHYHLKERCIFCDILNQEFQTGARLVQVDPFFVTHCPYASRFPFEMHLHPRKHSADFSRCDDDLLMKLAQHMKEVLRRMNKALGNPPYNFLLHTTPNVTTRPQRRNYWDTLDLDWHWHIEILPRITNVAGFEWGTGFYINPTPPEEAAKFLRQVDL